jgi:tetratricopeptide (TPR) repeat protein
MLQSSLKFTLREATLCLMLAGCFISAIFTKGSGDVAMAPSFLCVFTFFAVALYPSLGKSLSIPRTVSFLAYAGFFSWLWVSVFWSSTPYISTVFAYLLGVGPIVFISILLSHDSHRLAALCCMTTILGLSAFAAGSFIQFLFYYDVVQQRIHAPMLNPNNYAGVMNGGFFLCLAAYFYSRDQLISLLSCVATVFFYIALLLTQSRGGLASLISCLLLLLPFLGFGVKGERRLHIMKLASVAVIMLLVPVLVNAIGEYLYSEGGGIERIGNFTSLESTHNRILIWQSSWEMLQEFGMFGMGLGLATFYLYYPAFRVPADESDGFFAHLDPLQFWIEMGPIAPLLFYIAAIAIVLRSFKAFRLVWGDHAQRIRLAGVLMALFVIVGHTHITFHLYMPVLVLLVSVVLAYWYVLTSTIFEDSGKSDPYWDIQLPGFVRQYRLALLFLLCGAALIWPLRSVTSCYFLNRTEFAMYKKQYDKAERMLEIVKLIKPKTYSRYYEYEAKIRLTKLWGHTDKLETHVIKQHFDEGLAFLDIAEKYSPAYFRLPDLRARFYSTVHGVLLPDGRDQAIEILIDVVRMNPGELEPRIGLARLYELSGDLKSALSVMEDGLKWPRIPVTEDLKLLARTADLRLKNGNRDGGKALMAEVIRRTKHYKASGLMPTKQ